MKSLSIIGPQEMHRQLGVASPESLLGIHATYLAEQRRLSKGAINVTPRPAVGLFQTYINQGRLLIDCVCGAGVGIDDAWKLGCCFECGRVYRQANLIFITDEDMVIIDAEFVKRRDMNRNFDPRKETLGRVLFVDGVQAEIDQKEKVR